MYLPSSYRQKVKVFGKFDNMTMEDAALMLSKHICWLNRRENEFLSWTCSLLFLFSHAILRHEKGQQDMYVSFGDVRKLKTPSGDPASFYRTIVLLDMLPPAQLSSVTALTARKPHPRHFTHESVSFGEMRDPEGAIVRVEFEELIRNGLLELMPELVIEDRHLECTGLYQFFVWLKRCLFGFNSSEQITENDLKICRGIAELFKTPADAKAPFWCFIKFLAIRKRPDRNSAVRKWVKRFYYGKSSLLLRLIT